MGRARLAANSLIFNRFWAAVRGMAAFASGLRSELMVLRKAAFVRAYALAAFPPGLRRETGILREAAFFMRYAFPAFACDGPLLLGIHGRKTPG